MKNLYYKIKKMLNESGIRSDLGYYLSLQKGNNYVYFDEGAGTYNIDTSNMPTEKIILRDDKGRGRVYIAFDFGTFGDKRIYIDKNGEIIKSILPLSLRLNKEKINKIVNYVDNQLYNAYIEAKAEAKEDLRKIEEKLKQIEYEREHDPKKLEFEGICSKAERIARSLGRVEAFTHDDDLSSHVDITEDYVYDGYGLHIRVQAPYKDSRGSGVYIYYNDECVLDQLHGYSYSKGRWQEVLEALYNKKYTLSSEKHKNDETLKDILYYLSRIDSSIPDEKYKSGYKVKSISMDIADRINRELSDKNLSFGIHQNEEIEYELNTFCVSRGKKSLLCVTYDGIVDKKDSTYYDFLEYGSKYYRFKNHKFVPGEWVDDFKSAVISGLANLSQEEENKYNSEIDKQLSLIKKL